MSLNKTEEIFRMEKILAGPRSTRMIVSTTLIQAAKWGLMPATHRFGFASNTDTNKALHFYSHENAFTSNGMLNITTEQKVNNYKAFDEDKKVFYADKKHVQSGMLQSWNKFCFIGGIVEFSAKLPGDPISGGLWPARKLSSNDAIIFRPYAQS
jgi:beta-glucanase (GH16 family)